MRLSTLLRLLKEAPVVASVQASPGSPVDETETLLRLARASLSQGVRLLRLQGEENIRTIKAETETPVIGLIKRDYPDSPVYITPTRAEVQTLIELGCEIIALDATDRPRPNGSELTDLIVMIHDAGRLAMADCDGPASLAYAHACGADILSTTLAGYTGGSASVGPDIELISEALRYGVPVFAEGRYSEPWHVRAALARGASGVVIGGSINDPIKQTRAFCAAAPVREPIAAVDIGGTWIRYGLFDESGGMIRSCRDPLPGSCDERVAWIGTQLRKDAVERVGIATGGTVDPDTGVVWESKPIIPDNVGACYASLTEYGASFVRTLNDGHATAWGHAWLPEYAGKRVATLALGTGVGFGLVDRGRILMGPRGEYPRINDIPTSSGASFEELLGGAALTQNPDSVQMEQARQAARDALNLVRKLYYPDVVIICGGVGLSGWLETDAVPSPYGADSGLYGAAALARYN